MDLFEQLKLSFKSYAINKAFCIEGTFYSYKELEERVDKIAFALDSVAGKETNVVGLITDNHIDTYAGIMACWMTGRAYVPINPRLPSERNREILRQAGAEAIINPSLSKNELIERDGQVTAYKHDITNKVPSNSGDLLMYILFTSGSTGIPKGVPISYNNLSAFVNAYDQLNIPVTQEDRCLQMFDLTFDVSIVSFLIPLLNGACIYTVSTEGIKYTQVYKVMREYKITYASIVPSVINYLRPYFNEIQLPSLKYCILTAEASKVTVVQEWAACIPNADIYNLYGPTEATIWCTANLWNSKSIKSYNEMLAIGKPFNNTTAVIVDENLMILPVGQKGQLCISGPQITSGYINNPEKNNESFFLLNGESYYKTGDLCFFDDEGSLFYCGRLDHQVKIQGFRVELSEIEVMIRSFTGANVAAIAYKNVKGVTQLGVFIERDQIDAGIIRKQLSDKLPYYMIPSEIRSISRFPLNTSGKLNRLALEHLLQNSDL